jgi:uncharacterized UPF0160 family protein
VRSRERDIIDSADVCVDVGGVYDHATRRYDHHQQDFTETFSETHNTKLSSAGLVFRHYGHEILAALLPNHTEDVVSEVYRWVYQQVVEAIDAADNGIS